MSQSITVYGGNLFMIAAVYLNDATQWNRIAEASGTGTDPVLAPGVAHVLTIPDVDATQGGGIYNGDKLGNTLAYFASIDSIELLLPDGSVWLGTDGAPLLGTY